MKLNEMQFPTIMEVNAAHQVIKSGYRIFPIDVPLQLVDDHWCAHADVVINQLIWAEQQTVLKFYIHRTYDQPFALK